MVMLNAARSPLQRTLYRARQASQAVSLEAASRPTTDPHPGAPDGRNGQPRWEPHPGLLAAF